MYNQGLWSAFFWLHNIKRISKFLSRDNLVAVIHAFIASRLDYWYSLLYDLPNIELAKLQRVQNAAVRSVTTTGKYDQITPILCEFHWLPVKFRIHFKILLLTFKALHGMTPNYIRDLLTIRAQGRYSFRSNSSIVLEVHGVNCYDHFEIAPSVWPLQSFGMNCLWQCVTFQHLVFIKGTSKRIFFS